MKARIVITQEGILTVFVDEGTFEEASAAAKNLITQLGAVIVSADEPEQHRHDPDVETRLLWRATAMSTNVVVGRPTAPPTATDRNGFPDPPFWLACKSALMSGSTQAIILHLNTRDYALPGKFLVPFLTGRLATRDIVAIYNRSSGIRFPCRRWNRKRKTCSVWTNPPKPRPTRPSPPSLL